jgi:hypothetical protein
VLRRAHDDAETSARPNRTHERFVLSTRDLVLEDRLEQRDARDDERRSSDQ